MATDVNPRDCWGTPDDFYGLVDSEFHFSVDVCADENNAKHRHFISPKQDALAGDRNWLCAPTYTAWCNPPYSKPYLEEFLYRARVETRNGQGTVVVLVPAATQTRWWYDLVWRKVDEIRFLTKRIEFVPPPMVDPKTREFIKASSPRTNNALVIFRRPYTNSAPPPRVWWWDWRKDLEG